MSLPKPYFEGHGVTLYRGDSLRVLLELEGRGFDALCTDPPYSSGGTTAAERQKGSTEKYLKSDDKRFKGVNFSGDTRDQRSQLAWMSLWLSAATATLRPSASAYVFTDWRQLPLTTDAVQAGGLTWRGVVPWNKGRMARAPHTGFRRHQCEYAVWATRGKVERTNHGGPWSGFISRQVNWREKNHPASKPVGMMAELLEQVTPGGVVLDPFAGGGATLAACVLTGRRVVGVEIETQWCDASAALVEAAAAGDLDARLPAAA